MTAGINVYRTTHIDAKFFSHNGTHWVEMAFIAEDGTTSLRCSTFFTDKTRAQMYAAAVNAALPALEAAE